MGQFLKQVFASLIGTVAGLTLFVVLGTGGLILLVVSAAMQDTGPTVKDKSILVFDLSTEIRDTKPPSTLSQALQEDDTTTLTLREVLDAIEAARKDRRIMGIFLDGRGATGNNGYATLAEVRTALERFRAAGKRIIAYDVDMSERDYYLTSVADTVMLNPMGVMEINGFGTQPMFLAGALKKYGIGVQVVRVGQYKSAVEPYIRQDLSPANRQQLQTLLSNIWGNFLTTVAKSRKTTTKKLQTLADTQGSLTPQEAKKAGLVDQVAYFDEALTQLKELTKTTPDQETFPQISLETYTSVAQKSSVTSPNKIAVIYAQGEIVNGQGTANNIGGDRFAKELRKIREDKDIKAVVLRVNSPGGSATASEIIGREVELLSKEKPLTVSMGNVAASGGYWISTGGGEIFAEPNTITGSIGVFGLLFNLQDVAKNHGITWDGVKTAKFADISTSIRPKTEQELAIYQRYVEEIYDLFIAKVARSRNLPDNKVKEIAQGRVWSGMDAQKIGLVDQIGGLDTAIQYTAKKANLGNNWKIEEYPLKRSFEAEFLEKLFKTQVKQPEQSSDLVNEQLLKLKQELDIFKIFNDPQDTYAYFPFNLQIK